MKLEEIRTPVSSIAGVGPALSAALASLSLYTVGELFAHYPRAFDDRTRRIPLAQFAQYPKVHTVAQVFAHRWFGFGRTRTLKIMITDGSADAELAAFNRPFLEKTLPVGSIISVTGAFSERYGALQSASFEAELVSRDGNLADFAAGDVPGSAVLPVYPLAAGLTQVQLRKIMRRALQGYGCGIDSDVPPECFAKRGFMPKQQALHALHNPKTLEEAEHARASLIYEELFCFQRGVARRALEHKGALPSLADCVPSPENRFADAADLACSDSGAAEAFAGTLSPRQKQLLERLPFSLTRDQMTVIAEINADIDRGYRSRAAAEEVAAKQGAPKEPPPPLVKAGESEVKPLSPVPPFTKASEATATPPVYTMARLLQGDVGAGKTLAAFFACVRVADWGGQSAFLAPTELLARQHAETAAELLSPLGVRVAYLTGSIPPEGRARLLKALGGGAIDVAIGTHALFSRGVAYRDLQLAVIDEQHRFGVLQRNAIIEKGRKPFAPHLLMMSATPIPRTLALTAFGDLDISVIRSLPQGRLPVKTYLARMGNEQKVYDFVRRELEAGHQAYFVYPRIEDADSSGTGGTATSALKNAEDMYRYLSGTEYPQFAAALIHSKVDEDAQHRILRDFRAGAIRVLVATSVVEVGVDNPNATCMVVEHADRFGLAALHQIRGRVGRGSAQSYCFLVYGTTMSEAGARRMKALRETADGFRIAEEDLRLRGPGEISGIQQSGYLTLGIADLARDTELLEMAREDAFREAERSSSPHACGVLTEFASQTRLA